MYSAALAASARDTPRMLPSSRAHRGREQLVQRARHHRIRVVLLQLRPIPRRALAILFGERSARALLAIQDTCDPTSLRVELRPEIPLVDAHLHQVEADRGNVAPEDLVLV